VDPKSLERRRGSAVPHFEVSVDQQYREWRDRVRGRVGLLLIRVPWHTARELIGDERLRALFDAGEAPGPVAQLIVDTWKAYMPFEAPLC
jgi:hypothetical protein